MLHHGQNRGDRQSPESPTGAHSADTAGGPSRIGRSHRVLDSLYGFGELISGAFAQKNLPAASDGAENSGHPGDADFAPLIAGERASISIRSQLFPEGSLRSIGWEILVALYGRELSLQALTHELAAAADQSMKAALVRHLESLETAQLVASERDNGSSATLRLTPDGRNTLDCYFRELAARASN